jgi:hypothetical protein
MKLTNSIFVKTAINERLLQLAAIGLGLALVPSGALATTITSADIAISNLTISGGQSFFLSFDNGTVTAQAGPDSSANQTAQTLPISNATPTTATSANATITTSTASATNSNPLPSSSGTLASIPGTVSASSSVNLVSPGSSHSFGIANPLYQFLIFSGSKTIDLTFSMTIAGSLSGSSDALGSYASEVTAQFGYQKQGPPGSPFIPVVFFDTPLSGGLSNSQNDVIGSTTLTGIVTLLTGVDYFFFASVEAQSSATELGTSATPLPAALPLFATGLGALGLLGWRRKRKNAAALAA